MTIYLYNGIEVDIYRYPNSERVSITAKYGRPFELLGQAELIAEGLLPTTNKKIVNFDELKVVNEIQPRNTSQSAPEILGSIRTSDKHAVEEAYRIEKSWIAEAEAQAREAKEWDDTYSDLLAGMRS